MCYVVCGAKDGKEKGREDGGGVLLLSLGSLPTAPWGGGGVTGPGRHSPVTSKALLTPVCSPYLLLPPDIMLRWETSQYTAHPGDGWWTILKQMPPCCWFSIHFRQWHLSNYSNNNKKDLHILRDLVQWTEICYSSFLMSCLSS